MKFSLRMYIILGSLFSGLLLTHFLSYIPLLDYSTVLDTDNERLRIVCSTVSINGSHHYVDGGKLSFKTISVPVKLWLSSIDRLVTCHEFDNQTNQRNFTYTSYYFNQFETDLSSMIEREESLFLNDNETFIYYYYGNEMQLSYTIRGHNRCREKEDKCDIHGMMDKPYQLPYQLYYIYYLFDVSVRGMISFTIIFIIYLCYKSNLLTPRMDIYNHEI